MYQDGTSSLAASLIEKVPHKCKHSSYGCEVRDLLGPLKVHEAKCVERPIKCLSDTCEATVQVRKFEEHAKANKCCADLAGPSYYTTFSSGFMKWDGLSKNRGVEFDIGKENTGLIYNSNGGVLIFRKYHPKLQTLVFTLITSKSPEEAEKYSAKISIQKGSLKSSYEFPLISVEQLPPEEDFPNHEKCLNVHYSLFRKFLHFEDKGENNNHDWLVRLYWKLEINEIKNEN